MIIYIMVATLVLNSTNIVPDGYNNKLVYNFPNSVSFPNHEIAIQSINMYYSWENINGSSLNNNTFWFRFPTADGVYTQIAIVIPDGLYEISSINSYLQWVCIGYGWYLTNSSGVNIYFAEFVINPSNYAVQLNTYPVLTLVSAQALSYIIPTGYPNLTASNNLPQVSMFDFNLGSSSATRFIDIVGFPATFISPITTTNATGNYSFVSPIAPQVQPNPILYLAVSNIENKYASPSSIIGTVTPSVAFGDLITEVPPQFAYNKLLSGTYNGIRLSLLGSNGGQIPILDPNITIVLVIRDKADSGLKDAIEKASGGK